MKTNLNSYNKRKLKRKLEADDEEQDVAKDIGCYAEDLGESEDFEVGENPLRWVHFPSFPGDRLYFATGVPCAVKIYDSSRSSPNCHGIIFDRLLCFSRLAMAFYNIRMGTHFRVVKVLMAAERISTTYPHYITFEAERNTGGSVTFQTKIFVFIHPCPKIQILFVRIKPDHNKSNNSRNSEFDHNAQVVEDRTLLSQVINTYTIDSRLDSQYSLALYLSQYALVSHNLGVLKLFVVAKHDIESLKVLKLVKPDSEVPTYLITFEASVHAETERKSVETFETKICMPTLFPTTTIELRSEARVITDNGRYPLLISISSPPRLHTHNGRYVGKFL